MALTPSVEAIEASPLLVHRSDLAAVVWSLHICDLLNGGGDHQDGYTSDTPTWSR